MKLLELLNGVDYKVLQGSDEKEINKIQYERLLKMTCLYV